MAWGFAFVFHCFPAKACALGHWNIVFFCIVFVMDFSIAGTKMQNRLVLAPMYRVTDLAFRLLAREQGASLCYSEMINSEALIRNNLSVQRLAQTCREDRPLAMQVFGARVESMKKAAELLIAEKEFDFLDLNLGCPSGNVLNQGAGVALLRRPARICEILSCWHVLGKPVTVKIRSDQNVLHTIKLAKQIEMAGASAIAVHGRTIKQENRGLVDFVAIKRVKRAVGIPVIGNGGVINKNCFERMLEKTGCDAVMVGSAAIGNPGIFAEILGNKPIARKQAFLQYLELCKKFGISAYLGRMKTQAVRFFALNPEKIRLFEKAQSLEEIASIARS
jgi:nifR3 family TIM-barrel protein